MSEKEHVDMAAAIWVHSPGYLGKCEKRWIPLC